MKILEEFWYDNIEPTEYDIKIHIGNGGKKAFHHQTMGFLIDLCIMPRRSMRQTNERARQLILQNRRIFFLSANARLAHAALTACRLLALKTKHAHDDFSSP